MSLRRSSALLKSGRAAALLAAMLLASSTIAQESEMVTPDTLAQKLLRADGGTILLTKGNYGRVVFPRKNFQPMLRIDAKAAQFEGVELVGVTGVSLEGGTIFGPGGRSYGISIRNARNIRVTDMLISGAHRGIVVNQGEDVILVGNTLSGLISDGINVAYSRRVRIERNRCSNFQPNLAIYDHNGNRLRDGDHPDCIQAWSRPQFGPTSDLAIIGNEADGSMQGIFLGNHVRNGVDDGGFDRILVRGNRVRVSMPNGIVVMGVRGGEVIDNVVRTTPGAVLPNRPDRPVRAKLLVEGTNVRACGNHVEGIPRNPGMDPCK